MISPSKSGHNRKQGVALVVVLGLLAVMVLLGVSFSIAMRTERMAASSYLDTVRARHMMDVALAAVLTEHLPAAVGNSMLPDWLVYPSVSGGRGTNFLEGARFRYVPGALTNAAVAADVFNWRDIRDYTTDQTFHGQYAFMIINNSGMLDANVVAGRNRDYGRDPAEIQIAIRADDEGELLREVQIEGDLATYRDLWFGRFDTIPELHALGSWSSSDIITRAGGVATAPFRSSEFVNHFHIFSRFANQRVGTSVGGGRQYYPKAYVGGAPEDWDADATIITALTAPPNAPFDSDEDARNFLNQMKDFATSATGVGAFIPENINGMSFKRVPMINEVVISNFMERVASTGTNTVDELILYVDVAVETWYPFPTDAAIPNFVVTISSPPRVQTSPVFEGFNSLQLVSTIPDDRHTGGPDDFRVWRFRYRSDPVEVDFITAGAFPARTFPVAIIIEDNIDVNLPTGQAVNRVVGPWSADAYVFPLSAPVIRSLSYNLPTQLGPTLSCGVFDPRLNWDPSDAGPSGSQWRRATASLGSSNTTQINSLQAAPADEVGNLLYCAQRPFRSLGDIAYLLYLQDRPWETVRLLPPDGTANSLSRSLESARIFDRLTTTRDQIRSGLVNINTPHVPVLAAAMHRAPLERWPGDGNRRINAERARAIAQDWVNAIPSGGVENFSDVVGLAGLTTGSLLQSLEETDGDKFFAESAIRNSVELLGAEDTLFTVFINTRVFPSGYDPEAAEGVQSGLSLEDLVLAEQRALAVVWRDPVTGSARVISFIWLPDFD
jgi:hypothetical protein